MVNLDTADIKKVSRELDAFYTALKSFIYYIELNKQGNANKNNSGFWDYIEFTLLYTMLVNWNEVFGIAKQNKHWNEITLEDSDYINRLYTAGEFNYTSWTEYRNYINELNHNFILFPDPYHHTDQKYNLEGIKVSLEVTHEWFHELVSSNEDIAKSEEITKWPIKTKDHINNLRQEIQAVIGANY